MNVFFSLKLLLIAASVLGTVSLLPPSAQFRQAGIAPHAIAAAPGIPIRLVIPKIKVDALIETKGISALGAMEVPKGPTTTAWFDLGPRPGERGSAVIAGHFGWKDGISAVFDGLHTLEKGDKIMIFDAKGAETFFLVREVRSYGENENASDVFGSADGGAHLNLVTCEGVWNKARKSYSDRVVVFADKTQDETAAAK